MLVQRLFTARNIGVYANIYAYDLDIASGREDCVGTEAGVETDFQDKLDVRIVQEILDEKVALL